MSPSTWRDLMLRALSAVALVPPLLLAIFYPRPIALALVVHAAAVVALGEFYWMALPDCPRWMRLAALVLGLAVSVAAYWTRSPDVVLAVLIAVTLSSTIALLFCHVDLKRAAADTALVVFGALYVPLLLTTIAQLRRLPDGSWWVVLVLTVTWSSDTAAYLVGRNWGRTPLYPAISPGKSVEGATGGVLGAFVAGVAAKLWYLPALTWVDALLLGCIGSVLGQIGDLVESMFKRSFGVKDSGRILPGHGGLLDRIDGLLFIAPFVYLYASHVVLLRAP